MRWTALYANKHKQRKQDTNPPTKTHRTYEIIICNKLLN